MKIMKLVVDMFLFRRSLQTSTELRTVHKTVGVKNENICVIVV